MEQHIHVEAWDYSRFWLNSFLGYESMLLLDVAGGSMHQTMNIYDKMERDATGKALKASLSFKLLFEEVWDY
jgi:hypothetical protein